MSNSAQTSSWHGAIAASALLAVVVAVAVALRILFLEEAFSDRALLLVLIAAEAGFATMLVVALPALWLAQSWPKLLRGGLGAVAVAGLLIPATLFFFALQIRVIDGRIEADNLADMGAREFFWSMFGAMGMFTPTGLRYLLPWTVPVAAAISFVIFYRWPRRPTL